MLNTAKVRALVFGSVGLITELLAHIANIPPEQQTQYIGMIVNVFPENWRATMGLICKTIARSAVLYAIYAASHSGPQTPPKNPPTE